MSLPERGLYYIAWHQIWSTSNTHTKQYTLKDYICYKENGVIFGGRISSDINSCLHACLTVYDYAERRICCNECHCNSRRYY